MNFVLVHQALGLKVTQCSSKAPAIHACIRTSITSQSTDRSIVAAMETDCPRHGWLVQTSSGNRSFHCLLS
jgi:hypothetical protein